LVAEHDRRAVNNAVDVYVNRFEWRLVRIHARYPGPLKPVKKTYIQRMKVPSKLIDSLMSFLQHASCLQRTAFGQISREIDDYRISVEMGAVSRTKKLNKI
jgi:hypothetical protein